MLASSMLYRQIGVILKDTVCSLKIRVMWGYGEKHIRRKTLSRRDSVRSLCLLISCRHNYDNYQYLFYNLSWMSRWIISLHNELYIASRMPTCHIHQLPRDVSIGSLRWSQKNETRVRCRVDVMWSLSCWSSFVLTLLRTWKRFPYFKPFVKDLLRFLSVGNNTLCAQKRKEHGLLKFSVSVRSKVEVRQKMIARFKSLDIIDKILKLHHKFTEI